MKKLSLIRAMDGAVSKSNEVFVKQKLQRTKLAWMIILFVAIIFASCGDNGGGTTGGGTAPTITTSSLLNGKVGVAYNQTLTATGDTPITWSVTAGALPSGLTLSGAVISGMPTTAGTFHFTVKATNTEGSATKQLSIGIAQEVGDEIPSETPPPNDFITEYEKLGLGSKPINADALRNAMNNRWNNAQVGSGTLFYPVLTAPTTPDINVAGETLNGVGIYSASPEMIFLIKGSNLTIWGRNNDTPLGTVSISFDIAIIRNSDGKGWLWQGLSGTPYRTESYAYGNNHNISYVLSDLTGGAVTQASDLGNYSIYSVYIIVRDTSLLSTSYGPDFNKKGLKNENVIMPVIR